MIDTKLCFAKFQIFELWNIVPVFDPSLEFLHLQLQDEERNPNNRMLVQILMINLEKKQ